MSLDQIKEMYKYVVDDTSYRTDIYIKDFLFVALDEAVKQIKELQEKVDALMASK